MKPHYDCPICGADQMFSDDPKVEKICDLLRGELWIALGKFPRPQSSAHEAYAVLLEEVDELWDAIKANEPKDRLRAEAIQVGAMAMRFVMEVADGHAD